MMKAPIPLILILLFVAACASPGPANPADESGATPEKVENVSQGINAFAIDMYKEIEEKENVFFSPYSISTALAMTYEGARGETATEMAATLHFPEEDVRQPGYATLYNRLQGKQEGFEIATANALWAQEEFAFLPEYFSLIERYYGGKATTVDFKTETEETRRTINSWVAERTRDRIDELLSPGDLKQLTRLVLTNAIYFKGDWVWEFDKEKTGPQPFYIAADEQVTVELMSNTNEEARFGYAEDEQVKVLRLPYEGDRLSMLVILPKEIEGLQEVEESLSVEQLDQWRSALREMNLPVYLPKFEFEDEYRLKETLQGMGMPLAFSDEADFSGMNGRQDLKIDKVIHKAFVAVDEKGTEAAAATAVVMVAKIGMPVDAKIFRADHPFLFLIQDDETGAILFMGKVSDPSALQ